MSQAVKNYDSAQVVLIVNGIAIQSGRDEGDFVKVTMKSDAFTSKVGSDGEVARSKSNDERADVEVTTMQTSLSNDALSAMYLADVNVPGGFSVGPFLLKDINGTTLVAAAKCWIRKVADVSFGKETGTRVWNFELAHAKVNVGGSLPA